MCVCGGGRGGVRGGGRRGYVGLCEGMLIINVHRRDTGSSSSLG